MTVIELAGPGPDPMADMLLAGLDASLRGKKLVVLNPKDSDGREALLKLVETADVLTGGFRAGVTEKTGTPT